MFEAQKGAFFFFLLEWDWEGGERKKVILDTVLSVFLGQCRDFKLSLKKW